MSLLGAPATLDIPPSSDQTQTDSLDELLPGSETSPALGPFPHEPPPNHLQKVQTSIQSLPPELLVHVFHYLVVKPPHTRALIQATHVCRLFRSVALDSPTLWTKVTRLYGTTIPEAQAFLDRSAHLLLDINLPASSLNDWTAFLLSSVLRRLRSLEIGIDSSYHKPISRLLASLVGRPAPHLKKLHFLDQGESTGDSESESDDDRIPRAKQLPYVFHIFDGGKYRSATPSLRSVRLAPVLLSWDSDIFKDLTHLELRATDWRVYYPAQAQLLAIFRRCPHLQTLALELPKIYHSAPRQEPEPVVPLPRLSRVIFRQLAPSRIANLLSYLALPPTTRFTIDIKLEDGSTLFPVFPDNREHLPSLQDLPSVEITVKLLEFTVYFKLSSWDAGGNAHRVATISVETEELEYIGNGIPATLVDSAQRLTYRGDFQDEFGEFGDWTRVFRAATRLRVLRLVRPGGDLENICQDLTRHVPDDAAPGGPARFCPELTDLELDLVSFTNGKRASIIWLLTDRQNVGRPLKRVVFKRVSGIFSEFIEGLREYGAEIVGPLHYW
ncbi:uncharacterized protein TRAVEDRAFT_19416 [Trametes versicolor FP-101664 SS1]|uniref:uncharacterized protein n=1 Tax=Trametes versicolor (strain FP-101664) TaxID=717944 RepID=UPI000462413B|nr:uncharacterized protein TRAVEDRAFT_19416 [Trametes versicolor FP-101664 SS1]EIW60866.1 hypothetical protein TRAVEDRAFT_19416 [Trametes versicolor FP-101664 SS1]